MAFEFNDLKGFLLLVLITIPLTTTTNINCNGKPFHCVNSTHFMICVDLGSGVSSTIDDFIIPCPPTTVCQPTNIFECEFPITAEPYPLDVIGVSVTSDMSTLPPLVNNLTTESPIEPTTAPLKKHKNWTKSEDTASRKLSEILENLKEEFTGGNETFFDVTKSVPRSTINPIDNIDEITTAKYVTNEKTTSKILNYLSTESAPLYVIEANITDHSQTTPNVRIYNTTRKEIIQIPNATKLQNESSTALPSVEEVTLPKESKIPDNLNKEYTDDNKHREMIVSPSNFVRPMTNLSESKVNEKNETNEIRTTSLSNPQSTTESASIYAKESNVSDNSQILLDTEAFDLKLNNIAEISNMKVPVEPTTALPMVNQNLTTFADLTTPQVRQILVTVKEQITGETEPYFQMTTSVPSSTITPSDNINAMTTTKYDVNKKVTNIIFNSPSTIKFVPHYEIEANVTDNSQTVPTSRTFITVPIKNTDMLSATNGEIKSSSAISLAEEVPLLKVNKITEKIKEEYISSNDTIFKITSVSPDDTESLTNTLKETTTNVNNGTHKKYTYNMSNPQSIIDSTAAYAVESNISETSQTLPNAGAFNLMLDNIINLNQSTTQVQIESSTALPISEQKTSTIQEIKPFIIDSVTTKVQIASTTAMPIIKQNLSTLADVISTKLPNILSSLREELTPTTLPSNMINSHNYLNETTTRNGDTKVKDTYYASNIQSTSETVPLYAIEQNITDNSHSLHAHDSIPNYIMETNQSTIKIPVESNTASPMTEQKLPILKKVISPAVKESQKEEYTSGSETFLQVVSTSPTKVIISSNTLNVNKITNKIFNSDSATESTPLQVTDVTKVDNVQTTELPDAEALTTVSKNIMALNNTTDHLKTGFQLQGNYNSLAITTTSRPPKNTEQSYVLLPAAHNMAIDTVVTDNLTSANIVLNKSNLNEIAIIEKPVVEEKQYIKGLDAKHIPSTTYPPSTNSDKTINIESKFNVHTTSTLTTEDINLHIHKETTLQNIDFNNDQISELASTIPLSYKDEIYETTPHPLHNNFNTTPSKNNDSYDLNSLNGVTGQMSTLVNYNTDIIYNPELKTVTPIAEVVLKKHINENTSKFTHLLSPIQVTYSSLLPTTKPEIIPTFTPQYSTLINESTHGSQRNVIILSSVFGTEQTRSNTLESDQVKNATLTSTDSSYTYPIGLSKNKVSEAHKSLTNKFKDIERSGIDISQDENMTYPTVVIIDRINTKEGINSTILTSKPSKPTDTFKDNNDDVLAADIPTTLNNITDYNLKTTSVLTLHEVFISKAKTNGVIFASKNDNSQKSKYYGRAELKNSTSDNNREQNITHALSTVITEQQNSKQDFILITTIKPVVVTSIWNVTENPLEKILKPYIKNTLVSRTGFIENISTSNTSGNEVLITTEAYLNHAKDESIKTDSVKQIVKKEENRSTRHEVNGNISTSFIVDKTVTSLGNVTQISNEGVLTTQTPLQVTMDQKKNVLSRIKPEFIITTENSSINGGFNKLTDTQIGSVKTQTKNVEHSNHPTKTITNSVNEQTSIVDNMTNPSNLGIIALGDIIFMNKTGSVNSLRNMRNTNTTAQKEALQKDMHDMSLNSRRDIDFNIREEINQRNGNDSLTEKPMNIDLGIDKKSDDISHENNYELSTAYFEVTSYTNVTTPNPLIKKETSYITSKLAREIRTEMSKSPNNLNQQQNNTNNKKLMSNVRVNKINNKEENQINYKQKYITSDTNNVNANIKPNINNTASVYNCWNNTRGKYADRKDCRKFYICFGKLHPIVGTCPENTVFSEINKQCTRNLSHCVRNNQFHCLYEGRFSDMLKENIYYICVKHKLNFLRYKMQCQDGYHLNKATVKCEKNEEKSSQITSSSVSENSQIYEQNGVTEKTQSSEKLGTSEQLENKRDLECKKEGKFSYPQDCSKYYVCSKNNKNEYRRKIKKCSDDKVYDKEKQKCVTVESSEC